MNYKRCLALIFCILLFFGTFIVSSETQAIGYDKIVHFRSFVAISMLLKHFGGADNTNVMLTAGGMAAIDEFAIQKYFGTIERMSDSADFISDLCGAAVGLIAYNYMERNGLIKPCREWSPGDDYGVDLFMGSLIVGRIPEYFDLEMHFSKDLSSRVNISGDATYSFTDETGEMINVRTMDGKVKSYLTENFYLSFGITQLAIMLPDSSMYRIVYWSPGAGLKKELSHGIRFNIGVDLMNSLTDSVVWWGREDGIIIEELSPLGMTWAYTATIQFNIGNRSYGRLDVKKAFNKNARISLAAGFRF
jgi:hypothetical protein